MWHFMHHRLYHEGLVWYGMPKNDNEIKNYKKNRVCGCARSAKNKFGLLQHSTIRVAYAGSTHTHLQHISRDECNVTTQATTIAMAINISFPSTHPFWGS